MGCTRGGYIYIYQTISESIINEFFLRTTAAEALDIFFISKRGGGTQQLDSFALVDASEITGLDL
jgi:hypothetical protein